MGQYPPYPFHGACEKTSLPNLADTPPPCMFLGVEETNICSPDSPRLPIHTCPPDMSIFLQSRPRRLGSIPPRSAAVVVHADQAVHTHVVVRAYQLARFGRGLGQNWPEFGKQMSNSAIAGHIWPNSARFGPKLGKYCRMSSKLETASANFDGVRPQCLTKRYPIVVASCVIFKIKGNGHNRFRQTRVIDAINSLCHVKCRQTGGRLYTARTKVSLYPARMPISRRAFHKIKHVRRITCKTDVKSGVCCVVFAKYHRLMVSCTDLEQTGHFLRILRHTGHCWPIAGTWGIAQLEWSSCTWKPHKFRPLPLLWTRTPRERSNDWWCSKSC